MGRDDCHASMEQEVHWGDCVCPPPVAVFTENTRYDLKENGHTNGHLEEESSFICRMCIPAGARTLKHDIKVQGTEYKGKKNFQLGYACACCCKHRPDVVLYKGESIVGSVQQPCCPQWLCKMHLDCYKGETRDENSKLWTIVKCICNCHTLFGKECGCCVDACSHLKFDTHGHNGAKEPELYKVYNGFINECCNMADKYIFTWPSGGTDERAIFLSAIHFFDLMYFENNYWSAGGV